MGCRRVPGTGVTVRWSPMATCIVRDERPGTADSSVSAAGQTPRTASHSPLDPGEGPGVVDQHARVDDPKLAPPDHPVDVAVLTAELDEPAAGEDA